MAKAGYAQRHTCPACGTVGAFRPGEPLVCKVCGTQVGVLAPAMPPPRPPVSPAQAPSTAPRGEPPTALAAVALACGILAFVTLWVTPVSILFLITALACGITALAQNEGDSGVQVMAGIGVGLATLALLLTWWAWALHGLDDGGSSVEYSSGGRPEDSGSGGGNGGDGGSSGSSGAGGGSGGAGGGSGGQGGGSGGAVEVGGGIDSGGVDAPMPAAALGALGLLAAAAWRRA